jgi:hypothetical protein
VKVAFAVYWLIGCLIVGVCMGAYTNKCPHNSLSPGTIIVSVATWPALFTFGAVWDRVASPAKCETP